MNFAKCPICGSGIKFIEKNQIIYCCCKNDCMKSIAITTTKKDAFDSWCKEVYKYNKIIIPQSK